MGGKKDLELDKLRLDEMKFKYNILLTKMLSNQAISRNEKSVAAASGFTLVVAAASFLFVGNEVSQLISMFFIIAAAVLLFLIVVGMFVRYYKEKSEKADLQRLENRINKLYAKILKED